jgi:hypothetical protein
MSFINQFELPFKIDFKAYLIGWMWMPYADQSLDGWDALILISALSP